MAIKAFSGGISSLPLPDIRLDNSIGEGDILVYDDSKKMFVNSVAADKLTGKLYITGITSNVKGQTILNGDGVNGNDIELRTLKSGNLIDIQPSNDGDSLVISVNASIASKLGGPDGFTGELKSSQVVLAGPGPGHEYQFRKIHNNEFIELNESLASVIGTYPKAKVIGVALNTTLMSEEKAKEVITNVENETGIPATDVVRYGGEKIFSSLI